MKQSEVVLNGVYRVKVSGVLVDVKLTEVCQYGGWWGRSMASGRRIRVRSAQRLRGRVT